MKRRIEIWQIEVQYSTSVLNFNSELPGFQGEKYIYFDYRGFIPGKKKLYEVQIKLHFSNYMNSEVISPLELYVGYNEWHINSSAWL